MHSPSRRAFLRGNPAKTVILRPPWAVANFLERCSRCSRCITACPEHILQTGDFNFPQVNFQQGACTFCQACVQACPDNALILQEKISAWTYRALIHQHCLAFHGVECRSCGEFCDSRAIVFRLRVGGVAQPQLNLDLCTGCGACYAPCPINAIEIRPLSTVSLP
ncbi:ferredoxin-type protein NapF [Beggiatoa alba B18LD]|uniref:Ferredoxin-type protein NapF n=1 Tax=Beggiatoa alba B18LD TaxID=395493 RepID=I3CHX3_9GAMM|nr:ferredoxin-type protein NapF [Beggiatoa alba]EIJ43216.1 ferredoxin-type protein NapF [Beggiatoa alba B18LD]